MEKIQKGFDNLETIIKGLRIGLTDNYDKRDDKYYIMIRCDSYDNAKKLCNKLHELGFRWNSGDSLLKESKFYAEVVYYFIYSDYNVFKDSMSFKDEEKTEYKRYTDRKYRECSDIEI